MGDRDCPVCDPEFAIGRIGDEALASSRHLSAGEEIDTRRAETTVGDVGGDHLIAVPSEYCGHGAVAAAWLPDRAAKADMLK